MAQVTVQNSFCDVLIDAADAHGVILDSSNTELYSGGAGLMKTFRFGDAQQSSRESFNESPISEWSCSTFRAFPLVEYIEKLKCMAPVGWPTAWPIAQTWNPITNVQKPYWGNFWRLGHLNVGGVDMEMWEFSDGRGTYPFAGGSGTTAFVANEFTYCGEMASQWSSPMDEPNMHLVYAAAAGQHLVVGGQAPYMAWTWNAHDLRTCWSLTIPVQLPVILDAPSYWKNLPDEGEEQDQPPFDQEKPIGEGYMHDTRRAVLWWRQRFGDNWRPVWQPDVVKAIKVSHNQGAVLDLKWETLDNHFIFTVGGDSKSADVYYIPPERRWNWDVANEELDIAYPAVRASHQWVYVGGHQGAFRCLPLMYPFRNTANDATWGWTRGVCAYRTDYYDVEHSIFQKVERPLQAPTPDINAYSVYWEPRDYTGNKQSAEVIEGANEVWSEYGTTYKTSYYQPSVQFTSKNAFIRSACYSFTIDWPPTISDRATVPATVQYDTNVEKTLVHANGSCNADWRNANCNLKLLVAKASADAVAAKCKANSHVHVDAGYHYTSDADVTVQVTGRQFTGRIADRAIVRSPAQIAMSVIELPLRDDFSRLEKHPWAFLGNFETRTVKQMFDRAMGEVGVKTNLISYRMGKQPGTNADWETVLRVDTNERRTEPRHEFGIEANFIECMNQMVEACGLRWGVDENGIWFVDWPAEYIASNDPGGRTPSTISYTIDDDETTVDDLVWELQLSSGGQTRKGGRGFVNAVMCVLDRDGRREVAWQRNVDSMQVGTSADFVGDVWTHIFSGEDENTVDEQARRIMDERMRKGKTLHFRVNGKPLLLPDEYVKLNATGLGGVSHDVFQITEKNWEVNGQQYKADFTAEWVATEVS